LRSRIEFRRWRAGSRAKLYACLLLAATWALPAGAQIQEEAPGDGRASRVGGDIKAYVLAPLRAQRPQWVRFGAAVGAIAFAYQFDDDVRDHFESPLLPAGEEPDMRDGDDALPATLAVGGTWVAAALMDDDDGRREAGAMLEAAALSTVAAYTLKQLAGRQRPFETATRSSFDENGEAFPSMHATAAFAIGAVLAESGNERHRWLRRVLGYGLAVGTAYARLDHDAHWFSDTVAGAALGIATARFVRNRRNDEALAAISVLPWRDGLVLAYQRPLRR
jgi:membrane-associated PAP2 superfamily phosphatase